MRALQAASQDQVEPFLRFRIQLADGLGRILQVAIHDHSPLALAGRQAGGDGGVLAEVAAQPHSFDVRVGSSELLQHAP